MISADGDHPPASYLEISEPDLGDADISLQRYTSQAFYDEEMECVWGRTWQWACREEQISQPGDFLVYDVGPFSALVVRQRDGSVKAFVNRRQQTRLSEDLPHIDIVHDLDEADRICAEHGCALNPLGEEVSRKLHFKPAELLVEPHIQKTYVCPACEGGIHMAPKPPSLIPKSMATPACWPGWRYRSSAMRCR